MNWFRKSGWVYIPASIEGLLISCMAIVFMIPVCIAVFRHGHSVSDNLYQVFVYGTCTIFWWKWVAEKTSKQ